MPLAVATDVASRDIILVQHYPQFPDSSLPPDVYGPLEVKDIVDGSVGIDPEL